jgi:hypothetical protein
MGTGDDLQHAYSEWRRLAEAEGKAIRAGDWPFVTDCQKAIVEIQRVIDHASKQNPAQSFHGSSVRDAEIGRKTKQRATVLELIELQRQNLAALEQRRQRLSAHVEEVSRSSRNLRGIQRSYTSPRPPAWNSYS